MTANANALDLLEAVAAYTEFSTNDAGERNPVLERFHAAKDRHIFRILSTIATPTHTIPARVRAFDELPKRVKTLGDNAVRFVRGLVRKCAMGDFLNQEIVHDCILLALEFGGQGHWDYCRKFLRCIELAADYFPEVCAETKCFDNLSELFTECRSSKEKRIDDILTSITSILAKAAPKRKNQDEVMDSNLRKDLVRFCRDGTPEQARYAVKTLTSLIALGGANDKSALDSLLVSLASPSALSVAVGSDRLVTVLAALAEFSDAAPETMVSERGQKAVMFALESVLLGRGQSSDENDESDMEDHQEKVQSKRGNSTTPQGRRTAKNRHLSPATSTDILDDVNLSLTCRKLCAAIEFLSSFTRSAIFASRTRRSESSLDNDLRYPLSTEVIEKLFDTLCNILRDGGMPPTNHDRKECNLRQDRSALRQCSAINLLRLCDARLALDQRFLTPSRWHLLAGAFLDDERVVRDKIMEELGLMLTGHGKYGKNTNGGQAMIPRFHFLAFVALCTDGENYGANGNAANVGKRANTTKMNAMQCVQALRRKYEVESEQARANGQEAEQHFELHMKVRLMPEYVVPYAFHLLAFRRETPSKTAGTRVEHGADDDSSIDSEYEESNESQERMLRKRLKWLFDPLVLSLGETADNISFLMRMSDKIARFAPVGFSPSSTTLDTKATARLKAVCDASRNVLMSYVKKDVNLATFPGQILVPGSLFRKIPVRKAVNSPPVSRASVSARPLRKMSEANAGSAKEESPVVESSSPQSRLKTKRSIGKVSAKTSGMVNSTRSPTGTHVHFSPDVATRETLDTSSFGALSPIERKLSMDGSPRVLLDSGEKTRGTTPPSVVRDIAFTTTASVRSSATVTTSPSSRISDRRRSLRLRGGESVEALRDDVISPLRVATQSTISVTEETSKRKPSDLDEPSSSKKSRPSAIPTRIKVVRNRPLQEVTVAKRTTRKRATPANDENFDFDVEDVVGSKVKSKATRSQKNNENSVQPQARSSKRRTKT